MRRSTVYTIILGCYMAVLAVLGASLLLNDERLAWVGLLAFTGLCIVSAILITLNVHEARTLARAVRNAANLADRLDNEANRMGSRGGAFTARAFATEIRAALIGETND